MAWVQVQRTLTDLDSGEGEKSEDVIENTVSDVIVRVVTDKGIEEHVLHPGESFSVEVTEDKP